MEHALEHRGVRLDEARLHDGQEHLGERAALLDLAGRAALDHRDELLGAHVRRRADRAGGAHEHHREEVGVLAAEHREVVGRGAQQLERVDLQPGRLLDADDVRVLQPPRSPPRPRGGGRCGTRRCRGRAAPATRRPPR